MPTALVFEHLAHEGPAVFADVLAAEGWTIVTTPTPVAGVDAVAAARADLLVVMGGPCGAYETDAYPFLEDEIAAIRARITANRPTLGVCLGAQLIAAAMGARVYPGPGPEIGWHPLDLTEAGRASPLAALDGVSLLHWHGDTFDLPPGVELLASTPAYPHQAFRHGPNLLALQCHPEVDGRDFEHWLIGAERGLRAGGGSVGEMREGAARHGTVAGAAGAAMLRSWLGQLR